MKLPRNLTGLERVKHLEVLGYCVSRQTGSHIRLTTLQNGEHHLTSIIPNHPIRSTSEGRLGIIEVKGLTQQLTP